MLDFMNILLMHELVLLLNELRTIRHGLLLQYLVDLLVVIDVAGGQEGKHLRVEADVLVA